MTRHMTYLDIRHYMQGWCVYAVIDNRRMLFTRADRWTPVSWGLDLNQVQALYPTREEAELTLAKALLMEAGDE